MRTEDYNDILQLINSSTTKDELQSVKDSTITELDAQLATTNKEIAKMLKLTNPVTFIAQFIALINEGIVEKTKEKELLSTQVTEIKEAYQTKLNTL